MPLSSMVDLEAGLQPSPKPRAESHTLLALEWALRWAMRVLSPCLVVFTTALVFTFVQIFFSDLVYLIATPYTVSYCAHSAAVLWIAANGMFNMLMCALTSPGYAPTRDELHRRILDGASIAPVLESTLLKPPRSQYCAISQKQVLKMDHFCPWVANSLGLRNYRYFYLFIWYLTVASWYGCSLCLFPFLRCRYQGNRYVQQTICVLSSRVKFALASSISVGSLVTAMLCFHTYLVLSAQTTAEWFARHCSSRPRAARNVFDLGWAKNWHAVFGAESGWCAWTLPSLSATGDAAEGCDGAKGS